MAYHGRSFLRAGVYIVLACALTALAGCTGTSNPFSKHMRVSPASAPKSSPTIYLSQLNGVPRELHAHIHGWLAHALHARRLTLVKRPSRRSFHLTGNFEAADSKRGAIIAYVWDLRDPHTGAHRRIVGEWFFAGKRVDGWRVATRESLAGIARDTARAIGGWYVANGYYVRNAALPPPELAPWVASTRRQKLAQAQPAPAHSRSAVDDFYVSGPRPLNQYEMTGTRPKPPIKVPDNRGLRTSQTSFHRVAAAHPAPRRASPITTSSINPSRLTAVPARRYAVLTPKMVMLRTITGANATATRAMRRELRAELIRAGFAVTEEAGRPLPAVTASVVVSPPAPAMPAKRQVTINWQVYDGAGIRIGAVTQTNQVATSAVNGDWNGGAQHAARAAAPAIAKLLARAKRLNARLTR